MKITIFYSWQARTNNKHNRYFLLNCIKKALTNINKLPDLNGITFNLLEGTTGEPGSVAIASNILDERIPKSDIFIADLTNINGTVPDFVPLDKVDEFRKMYQPTPNPNVLLEYGIAHRSLGEKKIISIVNEYYGSLSEYENLLPFDIRHLRFPIAYNYSSENEEVKADVQKRLIEQLTKTIKTAALYHLQTLKTKFRPFKTWNDWYSEFDSYQKFQTNKFINDIIDYIKESLTHTSIRIIGLSGLGKSRLLLETFKPTDIDSNSLLLSSRVLYYDFQEQSELDLPVFISNLQENNDDRIIILDNCDIDKHMTLLRYINKASNKLSLITIDSNPEELEARKINKIKYIEIKRENLEDVVESIIDNDFSSLNEEQTKKIKEFSQGIPLMATLLSESVQQGNEFIGYLDDNELLDKLLGEKGKSRNERKILQSCSLFNHIGFEEDQRVQVEYIAKNRNLTSIDIQNDDVLVDTFVGTCHHFIKRQIFERRGRFISMRPFPLAMYLAGEWLQTCTTEKMIAIISSIDAIKELEHKNSLTDSFAKQMRYLNFNPKAVQIVEKLVGPEGPFHDAKVLNTELGSRLFRSFVEVNPVAASKTLWNIFSNLSKEQLLAINKGRRNLIWALEKLCFDRRTFEQSSRTLFLLAIAENERWANNASGEISQLFKIFLAGTEANLIQRFKVLEWFLNYSETNKEGQDIFLKCINSALSTSHFSRMIGAEEQGVIKLKDYEPKSNFEIFDYWTKIIGLLLNQITTNQSEKENYTTVLLNSIRSITRYYGFHILKNPLETIFKTCDWDCEQGLRALKKVKKYDSDYLNDDNHHVLDQFIKKLTKTDFKYRFSHGFDNFYLDNIDQSYENEVKYFQSLAEEFIDTGYSWDEYFPIIFTSEPNFTYYFGEHIYRTIKDDKEKVIKFLKKSILTLESIDVSERNYNILEGFVFNLPLDLKEYFYTKVVESSIKEDSLYRFISGDKDGARYFNLIYSHLKEYPESIVNLINCSLREPLQNISTHDQIQFLKTIATINKDGYRLTLAILFHSSLSRSDSSEELVLFKKEYLYEHGKDIQMNDFRTSQVIIQVLQKEHDVRFAEFIHQTITNSISWENTYHLDHYATSIYEVLISNYFDTIWPSLSSLLMAKNEEYVKFYGLKHILGSSIGPHSSRVGILFKGDIDLIFNWAREYKEIAPERLAMLTPIYADHNNKYTELHSIAKRLVDEFGDIRSVLSELSANMGSYSWTGSTVPLLKSQLKIFKSLTNHKYIMVQEWATHKIESIEKEIIYERNRDQELYL